MINVRITYYGLAIEGMAHHPKKEDKEGEIVKDRDSRSCKSWVVFVIVEAEEVRTCELVAIKKGVFNSLSPAHN